MPFGSTPEAHRRAKRNARLALIGLIMAWLGIIIAALVLTPRLVPQSYRFNDFWDYYIGSRLFWDGKYPYGVTADFLALTRQYGLHFMWATGYSYPPFLAMAFGPMLLMPPETAAWIWAGVSMVAFCVLVYLISRKVEGPWRGVAVGFYFLTYAPAVYSIGAGQVNIAILYLMGGYLLGSAEWQRVLGLSLASMIKVYPILFLVKETVQRRFRFVVLCVVIMAIVIAVPAILRGPGLVADYFFRVLPYLNHIFAPDVGNQSLNGAYARLLSDPWQSTLMVPDGVLTAADWLTLVSILAGLVVLTLRRRYEDHVLSLIWLAGLTLVAGKNSFWNFTPCVFIGVYLLQKWDSLAGWQRGLFIASAMISNLLWYPVYLGGFDLVPDDLPIPRLLFVLIFSAGTISLLLEVGALLGLRALPAPTNQPSTGCDSSGAQRTAAN
jgi:Glycosyltransferase family 87